MPRVLIVDDAEFLRSRVSKMLTADSYEVLEAGNGAEGFESYKLCAPDVVLLDVTMPEMDGLTALKHIRAYDARARVIMLSALGQETDTLEAIRSGARDFVIKPINRECVLTAIQKILT